MLRIDSFGCFISLDDVIFYSWFSMCASRVLRTKYRKSCGQAMPALNIVVNYPSQKLVLSIRLFEIW